MAYGRRRGGGRRRLAAVPFGPIALRAAGQVVRYGVKTGIKKARNWVMKNKLKTGAGLGIAGVAGSQWKGGRKTMKRKSGAKNASGKSKRQAFSQYGEFQSTVRVRGGRNKPLGVYGLTKLLSQKRILRFQRVRQMNTATTGEFPGSFALNNNIREFGGVNVTDVPLHMYELTRTLNTATVGNGPAYAVTVNDAGGIVFTNMNTTSEGTVGTPTPDWQIEYADEPGNTEFVRQRYIRQDWYDIRFKCYGARNQPTRYDIMVVKFNDDYLDPLENPSNAKEADDRRSLYHGLVRPMMFNTIMPMGSGSFYNNKYRVLYRTGFTLQSTLNIENDVNPSSRDVRMFIRDGRIYDYLYHGDSFDTANADDRLNGPFFLRTPATDADFSESPKARARVWLVIRALNTTVTNGTVEPPIIPTGANTPSYDVVIRKRETTKS